MGRPALSSDHNTIAFEALRDGAAGHPSIALLDTRLQDIQGLESGKGCSFPSWAPDSSSIAVSCDLNIHLLSLDTLEGVLIADCALEDNACTDPEWSPDGTTILIFQAMKFRPNPGIYSLNTSCLDDPAACPAEPQFFLRGTPPFAWSPIGDKIAFITFEGGLGIASPQGEILEEIQIPGGAQIVSMAWSEEGDLLAITLDTYSNGQDSYLVPVEGGDWRRLSLAEGDSIVHFWVTIPG